MRNKNGFSLFEFMLTSMVILIVIVVAMPLLLYAIKTFRINAFKNSAYNVLEAVKYHIANSNFTKISEDGISISELNLDLKNNNFDDGIVKDLGNGQFEIVYLKNDNYCAKGTTNNMKATDEGCGALDETNPIGAYVYLKESTNNSITLIATGIDNESNIISYEFSIDGKKYTKASNSNIYTFKNLKPGVHKAVARVTNEASLSTTSEVYEFNISKKEFITCEEDNNYTFAENKKITCTYPQSENYIYQVSEDGINFENISLSTNKYIFNFDNNKTLYTRVIENEKLITSNIIKVDNIDSVLAGSYPELLDGMIPVIYDENKNSWVKANPNKIYWDYENKIWANSVLVKKYKDTDYTDSHSRNYYLSDEAIGKPIAESDILGFYVWIPKYQYKLFNNSNKIISPITIDISFNSDILDSNWTAHNSFSYRENSGFWVSKFQSSVSKTSNCYLNSNIENCNDDSLLIYMIPDCNSLTNISISKASLIAKNMKEINNIYGLSNNIDSHIITNLEWGAISYLANSIYGINDEIKSNNQSYKNNLINSTTGNITGVFDMVSNNNEFVMGNYNHDAGKNENDNSGFTSFGNISWPDTIDYYKGITSRNRLLGDATGETENWYNSVNNFVNGEYPFFIRGGSSLYNFDHSTGSSSDNITFRVVLSK